jgi:hypothetical protein
MFPYVRPLSSREDDREHARDVGAVRQGDQVEHHPAVLFEIGRDVGRARRSTSGTGWGERR